MERERERNISYEIYTKALKFRTERYKTLDASKVVAKAEDINPMWNSHGNTWYLVRKEMGFDTYGVGMFIEEIAPGKTNLMHRHFSEATVYILQGKGHTLLDEDSVEWEAGDAVFVPPMRWHEFYNDGKEPMRFIGMGSSEFLKSNGIHFQQNVDMVGDDEKPHFGRRPSLSVSTAPSSSRAKQVVREKDSQGLYEGDRDFERELEERRMGTKLVARGKDVDPHWDGQSWKHYLVDPRLGFDAYVHQIIIEDIPPGQHSVEHRHLFEEAVFVLEGKGHTILNGKRYDWKKHDALFLPPFYWHQSFNDDPDHRSRWLVMNNALIIKSLGYAPIEQREG